MVKKIIFKYHQDSYFEHLQCFIDDDNYIRFKNDEYAMECSCKNTQKEIKNLIKDLKDNYKDDMRYAVVDTDYHNCIRYSDYFIIIKTLNSMLKNDNKRLIKSLGKLIKRKENDYVKVESCC